MTFFLNAAPAPPIKRNQPDPEIADEIGEGLGAAITVAQLETDSNFIARRRTVEAKAATGWDLAERLGADAIAQRAKERGIPEERVAAFTSMMKRRPPNMQEQMQALVYDLAGEAAAADPSSWADIDFSEDAIFQKANERMQAEYDDAQQILDMMPSGAGMTRFVGGMIGITADVKNLPFLLLGGGSGSIMRTIGREAAINTAAEAAFLPAQYSQAERLEIPDPNIVVQLGMAAAAGGLIGGGVEAGARGLTYWRSRGRVSGPLTASYDPVQAEALVDEAEDILTSDTPRPLEQIERMMQDAPKPPPYRLENPINPERPPLLPKQDDVPFKPDQAVVSDFEKAIADAKALDHRSARPLGQFLRDNHKGGGENYQIHPEGTLAQELKSRDITPKTMPGLFSRKGRKDLDNLVADEMEANFPGIIDATGTQRGADYLDYDGFIDVLARDLTGDATWLRTRADVQRAETQLEEYLAGRMRNDPVLDDYLSGKPSTIPGTMFIDPKELGFLEPDDVRLLFDQWAEERGYAATLTPQERHEVITALQANGGDAESLLSVLRQREINYWKAQRRAEDAPIDAQQPDNPPAMGRSDGTGERSDAATGGTGRDAANAADDGGPVSEITDAGEQIVATGISPVSLRQRLEAAQNAPKRGRNAAADDGLFDMGARAQRDMFSDPASPEAQELLDTVANDFRTDIEANGASEINLPTDDGRVLRTDKDVLDELDADQEFLEVMDLCGKAPA